jgi:hypothetical protein
MRMILAILATFAISVAPALADDDDNGKRCGTTDKASWMSIAGITAKAEASGLEVRKVEASGGCYEVYGIDKQGQRVEAYLHPVSGAVVKTEIDD